MAHRALELLHLDQPSFILDIGCGSGLSGEILTSEGHMWVGMDISESMLSIAIDREVEGDLLYADMGQGVPFRPGSFDAAVSISAIQWLCNAETADVTVDTRLKTFFETLYASLKRGGRAALQFYPKDDKQRDLICKAAIKAGFAAGILEDEPGTKHVKVYLVLEVGGTGGDITNTVKGLEGVEVQDGRVKRGKKQVETRKDYIMKKKERERKKGRVVKKDSKYTGRKRRIQF
jgi:18S rRNA (guanine1575-N7)-methyltransferase